MLWNKNFILLSIGNLLMAIGFYFLIPTLPVYAVDVFGARPGQVGYILAAYTVSALLIRPFTGMALDYWGRKWIYLSGFFLFTVTIAIYPFMVSFIPLLILRFFHGFSWGITTTSGTTLVVDVIPPRKRGRGIGYYGISYTIAMAIAPIIALTVMAGSGFTMVFLLATFFSLSGFILVLFIRYPVFIHRVEPITFSFHRFIEPRSVPVSIPMMLYGISYGGVVSFITLYDQQFQFFQAGRFFILLAAGITISRLFAGKIMDQHGPGYLMITGFMLSVLGYACLGFFQTMVMFNIAAILIGIGSGILMPTLQAMVNNIVEVRRRGAANATFITAFDLGIGAGSLGLGILSEFFGYPLMYLTCGVILLVGLFYYLIHVQGFYSRHLLEIRELK